MFKVGMQLRIEKIKKDISTGPDGDWKVGDIFTVLTVLEDGAVIFDGWLVDVIWVNQGYWSIVEGE